jgi:rhodanese-related sulfurtransferase
VRTPEEYEQSHIPGAVLMPIDELPDRMAELPQNRWIITYCT